MRFPLANAPHLRPPTSVRSVMLQVAAALLPGIAVYCWAFGFGILVQLALVIGSAVLFEALVLTLRGRSLRKFLGDGSVLVTGVLLALTLPATAPWWIAVLGAFFAVVFGKQLYGGLGFNPFNPAMIGYVVLLICFPLEMSTWPAAGQPALAAFGVDAMSGATPLDSLRTALIQGSTIPEWQQNLQGITPWFWISLAYLAGGLFLLARGLIRWQIPTGLMLGLGLPALLFWLIDPNQYAAPWFHLFAGATMLGAFFIATDPVSASTTPRGRLLFGFGIGLLVFVIRSWGGYPDGIAFGVLLMNLCVPMIDHYTRPRVYGHAR